MPLYMDIHELGEVTADDVAKVCGEYLNEDNRTVANLISDGSEQGEEGSE